MELSRKRRRELKKLRGAAENVWNEQREVLDHASKVLRDAGRQATVVARKDVAPRVRDSYERRVQPGIDASVGAVRHATHATKSTVTDDILPAISGALGSAAAAIEVARDKHLREAIRTASRTSNEIATKAGQRLGLIEVKRSPGPGTFVLIGLGVVAAAAIAYAAWQTFRPDDDLWVEDDLDDDLEPATPEETSTAM
ncbi:MAG: hypothetical protein ACLGH5_01455 [Actinomycetes bacterium]